MHSRIGGWGKTRGGTPRRGNHLSRRACYAKRAKHGVLCEAVVMQVVGGVGAAYLAAAVNADGDGAVIAAEARVAEAAALEAVALSAAVVEVCGTGQVPGFTAEVVAVRTRERRCTRSTDA